MAKPRKPAQNNKQVQQHQPQRSEVAPQPDPQVMQVEPPSHQISSSFEGPIPPPALLREYDNILPGAAERIIAMAENEGRHRQALENKAVEANIEAQKEQLSINKQQVTSAFRSDTIGQTFGFILSAGCVVGSISAGMNDLTALSLALAAIPSAAIVKAFLNKD